MAVKYLRPVLCFGDTNSVTAQIAACFNCHPRSQGRRPLDSGSGPVCGVFNDTYWELNKPDGCYLRVGRARAGL